MSKRIVFTTVVLLLLLQAVPVLACVAMPAQGLAACCCEGDLNCLVGSGENACAVPDACCVQSSDTTPALSVSVGHPDQRFDAPPATHSALPARDPVAFLSRLADSEAAQISHQLPAPLPAVPLYLRHSRLTL